MVFGLLADELENISVEGLVGCYDLMVASVSGKADEMIGFWNTL